MGALGSVWQHPEEIRAVLKQGGIRQCHSTLQDAQSLAVNS